jgi:hypothetical protein
MTQTPDAGHILETAAVHAARMMSLEQRLTESAVADLTSLWWLDSRDLGLGDDPRFAGLPPGAQALLNRRNRGEFIPAFVSEQQLSLMRRRVRATVVNNEIALNAVNQRAAYAVGTGFRYEVVAKEGKEVPDEVVAACQAVVDAFVEHNELYLREPEVMARLDIDGEAFLRTFERRGGLLSVRFIEPEFVRSPNGDSSRDSFGVRNHPGDVESVEGYWVVEDPLTNPLPTFVDASEVLHVKHPETPMTSKRGLSAFYPVETNLRAVEDLVTSTVSIAKARAKIAWIQKLSGASSALATALAANQAAHTATDPHSGKTWNIEKIPYGSIFRIPDTTEIEMPSANLAAGEHATIMGMVLRVVAARFSMPEYLLSSDASNGSYSSTLVAESPFVKAMEKLQDFLSRHLGRNRFEGPRMSLVWRQLMYAAKLGLLPPNVRSLVDVQTEGPSLVTRNAAEEAGVNQTYNAMGVKSKKTIQMELSLDPDTEAANFAEEAGDGIPPGGVQGGAEGQEGQPPPGEEGGAPPSPESEGENSDPFSTEGVLDDAPPVEEHWLPLVAEGYLPHYDAEEGQWLIGDTSLDRGVTATREAGFTGEVKDGRGRRRCYRDGKLVPCEGNEAKAGQRRERREKADQERLSKPPAVYASRTTQTERVAAALAEVVPGGRPDDVAALVGAQNGAEVELYPAYGGGVAVEVSHPAIKYQTRALKVEGGALVCENRMFFLKKKHRGGGLGMKVFADQVRGLLDAGADRIETVAGKGGIMNGYYTWARLGYDAPLTTEFKRSLQKDAGGRFKDAKTVQDLMATPEGREHWKAKGYMTSMTFDLKPGSRSLQVLNDYRASKGLGPLAPKDPEAAERMREARKATRLTSPPASAPSNEADVVTRYVATYRGQAEALGISERDFRDAYSDVRERRRQAGQNVTTPLGVASTAALAMQALRERQSRPASGGFNSAFRAAYERRRGEAPRGVRT